MGSLGSLSRSLCFYLLRNTPHRDTLKSNQLYTVLVVMRVRLPYRLYIFGYTQSCISRCAAYWTLPHNQFVCIDLVAVIVYDVDIFVVVVVYWYAPIRAQYNLKKENCRMYGVYFDKNPIVPVYFRSPYKIIWFEVILVQFKKNCHPYGISFFFKLFYIASDNQLIN